jgi:lanosterol synthase
LETTLTNINLTGWFALLTWKWLPFTSLSLNDSPRFPEETDRTKWRLHVQEGRQVWVYDGLEGRDKEGIWAFEGVRRVTSGKSTQTVCEKYFLGGDISDTCPPVPRATTAAEAASHAVHFYGSIQSADGHWANDYGGPMFLMPGMVVTCYITGTEIPVSHKREMIVYLSNIQAPDGGWGLHVECPSNIFGTAMTYVALRLLGVPKDDARVVRARRFLHANDGAKGIPTWGKFWLASLGCYEWSGLNAVPPELWLLPDWFPVHPGRWWCHSRVVYLPMGYVYGRRATGALTPLVMSLREELYLEPYDSIDWPSLRGYVSTLDVYYPPTWLNRLMFGVVNIYEAVHSSWIRGSAMDLSIDHIRQEDSNTKHINIGPVNKMINMLAVFHADGPDAPNFRAHQERLKDYMWLSEDGMKMQGYNGSQLWDTAFSVQAILETGLTEVAHDTLTRAYEFIDGAQVMEDVPNNEKYYRHISKG